MKRLPDLAFGNADAPLINSSELASETLARLVPSISHIGAGRSLPFLTKIAARRIGNLGIVASSTLPSQMEVKDSQGWHLLVPYFGPSRVQFERSSVSLAAGQNALLMPNIQRVGHNATRSNVIVSINFDKLAYTFQAISRRNLQRSAQDDQPFVLDLQSIRGAFALFQRICSFIDLLPDHLRQSDPLGLEDLVYRWTALAMGAASSPEISSRLAHDHRIDLICETVTSNLGTPLTLTEMESLSGLSARTLQYAFKARFSCTPMEWQRQERIQRARERLVAALPSDSITSIAYEFGFSSPSAFSARYKATFGETPTQTLLGRFSPKRSLRKHDDDLAPS